jgi:uncharacterized membrane protein YccC
VLDLDHGTQLPPNAIAKSLLQLLAWARLCPRCGGPSANGGVEGKFTESEPVTQPEPVSASTGVRHKFAHLAGQWLGLHQDPQRIALRRGLRAAVVITTVQLSFKLIHPNPQESGFLMLGLISLLMIADFGGPMRSRARAYVVTTVAGACAIAVAALASQHLWLSVIVTAAFGFLVTFVGLFGGYALVARSALMTPFVAAVVAPASPQALTMQLVGWVVAGVIALAAALLLWPVHERSALRSAAGKACALIAEVVRAGTDDQPAPAVQEKLYAARAAIADFGTLFAGTRIRPAGLARQDRALAELVSGLDRTGSLLAQEEGVLLARWGPPAGAARRLAASVSAVLDGAAAELTGAAPPTGEIHLEREQLDHVVAVRDWAGAELRQGIGAASVLAGLQLAHPLRVLSNIALEIAATSRVIGGHEEDAPDWLGKMRTARSEIATHLRWSSIWVQTGLTAALAVGLSVLVARMLGREHGNWVVLGTFAVLAGSSRATGRKSTQNFSGAVIGFFVSIVFIINPGWNLFFLPICVFVAAYAPTAASYVVGQAAFTVFVVLLTDLGSFQGVKVGVVRIEDIAIGIIVSLIISLLLWPRGPRAQLPHALAALYQRCADYLTATSGELLAQSSGAGTVVPRRAAQAADARAGELFAQFLQQPGSDPAVGTWSDLFASGKRLLLVGDLFGRLVGAGYRLDPTRQFSSQEATLSSHAFTTIDRFATLARWLNGADSEPLLPEANGSAERQTAELACLRAWNGRDDEKEANAALGLVFVGNWLDYFESLANRLTAEVTQVIPKAPEP